jgi:hypothetical protein
MGDIYTYFVTILKEKKLLVYVYLKILVDLKKKIDLIFIGELKILNT